MTVKAGVLLGYQDTDGSVIAITVANPLPTSGAGGGGGGGDATAANQVTGNNSLATIATNTTGLATAANQTSTASTLSTIATNTTGASTAANQTTGNTSLASIATNTTGVAIASKQDTGNTSLASILTALGGPLLALGKTVQIAATLTRPADTTAYAALDTIANATSGATVITFSGAGRVNAASGYITKARIVTDQAANTARFKLHLFHTSPTALQDNAQYATDWANRSKGIGSISFDASISEGTGSASAGAFTASIRIPFVCDSSDTNLYGILETLDAFTPASAQNFYIELIAEQN